MIIIAVAMLSGCQPANPATSPDLTAIFESALLTATYAVPDATQTPTLAPPLETATPTPSPTIAETPPDLPQPFVSQWLNALDYPHTYIEDTCQYLRNRWDPNKSAPGTVVMPVMFHSITDGDATQPNQISHETLAQLIRDLREQGFEAITMDQLVGFLYENERIPQRSVILIVDDRHYADYYETHFKEFGVPVVNAWISIPGTLTEVLEGNQRLQQEGWVIHEGHGVVHNVPIQNWAPGTLVDTEVYGRVTSEEYIFNEINGSMETVELVYGRKPVAYIWPGGGFTPYAAEVAAQVGFKLGFTVNPRGPVMYNWIPLADESDLARPSYMPEGSVSLPLMVLPRYWDVDASYHIDVVREVGNAAAEYASANKQVELDYYRIVCEPSLGPIPLVNP
ncbi:MAG: hypothetical protein HPY76_15185 [Anaerolineae bacterium]|nr:hypothetical protein [Anaerolineae bacterium]NPV57997.1 hypothetical protein [Anaerolineae bacterium]